MASERELVEKCLEHDARSQELLYRQYVSKMYGVCLRFARNQMEAEDILQEGFIKVFRNLKHFRFEGSMEGWIRKTMVNTAINHYKKELKRARDLNIDEIDIYEKNPEDIIDKMSADEILNYMQELPPGYRIVFNLNVIEGYTHKMIGKMLNISENTSKSQLSRAKTQLKKMILDRRNTGQ